MFSHVMIGTDKFEKSVAFYEKVLGVLGAGQPMMHENATGQTRALFPHDGSILILTNPIDGNPAGCANGSTIGLRCNSPEQVKELHDVAVAAGGTSIEDPPGPRDGGALGTLHLCYFRDLDGHKICGMHRG
ncbi:VOC family protein [Paraurantiacibacter namhicola]|uniref:Glyoxalase-like domain protein n=1 Tax=Paraurantiacibacter namhicola TaxID=645517 RepID=A0A1C7D6I4_9SPHN|nr:VOC family protein [Paraurantiacibacter namhicola]ANU07077.1 Glyoxalase-like domain protein [Paraurantiacibacter namhicola]